MNDGTKLDGIITLRVDGQPRELKADYLNPAALEYWRAWLAHEVANGPQPLFGIRCQGSGVAG